MIARSISPLVLETAEQFPILTITGPRQSGKTTLCRQLFRKKPLVNLEPLDVREFATEDPRGFLSRYESGAVLDEFQNVPELAGYLLEMVDDDPTPGRFVLTGSQNLALTESVSQSLAGRTSVLTLLPFSLEERRQSDTWQDDLWEDVFTGGYPRIFDQGLKPGRWLTDYITTYVERDVRQLKNILDLDTFRTFLRLVAGRTGAEVNQSALGSDAGIRHPTVKAWLSLLQATYLIFQAPAWHRNLRKQLVKSPKLHFIDSGLACTLLGINDSDQLRHHPLRGAIFESWVVSEMLKQRYNQGRPASIGHYRQARGLEIDIVIEDGLRLKAIECKSGATIQREFLKNLNTFDELISERLKDAHVDKILLYGGDTDQSRGSIDIRGWRSVEKAAA